MILFLNPFSKEYNAPFVHSKGICMKRLPSIVFDVNETILDIETLTPFFAKVLGSEHYLREWFSQLVLYSQCLTITRHYSPFGMLGAEVLKMVAATCNRNLSAQDIDVFRDLISRMPALPDVPVALSKLKELGFKLYTLSNNAEETLTAQLKTAGIAHYFESNFSVDKVVKSFKPSPSVYQYVERELGLSGSDLYLVACHTWDIIGAKSVGWHGAMVLRKGNAILNAGPQPDVVGENLLLVADKIIESYSNGDANMPVINPDEPARGVV